MAAVYRSLANTLLQLLIFVFLLAGAASGLQIPHYDARVHAGWEPEDFGYRPGEVIVVDMGNTKSCVAGYRTNRTMFQLCIPSWVTFTEGGATLVGEAAKNHAGAGADPETVIFGFKRLFGLRRYRVHDEDIVQRVIQRVPYKIGAKNYHPSIQVKAEDGAVRQLAVSDVAFAVVSELKEKAEEHLGGKVWRACVTVPQHFQESPMWDALEAVDHPGTGLRITSIIPEPIAAAVAYGLHRKLRDDGNALVLHVGGGTADATIMTIRDGYLVLRAYRYDRFLGGDDFDQRIVDYFVKLIKTKHGKDISEDRLALGKLRRTCERVKEALSTQDHVQVSVGSLFDGVDFSEPLSRSKFEELNEDLFRKIVALVERVVGDAVKRGKSKSKNMVDEIVLVGGSTMIPRIQKLVKDYFDGKEPNIGVKPDEAVAVGAAVLVHSSGPLYR